MMLGHIFAEKFKTIHIVIAQLVLVLVRLLEILHSFMIDFLNFEQGIVDLLIPQFGESLLGVHVSLQSFQMILNFLHLVRKGCGICLQHFIFKRK